MRDEPVPVLHFLCAYCVYLINLEQQYSSPTGGIKGEFMAHRVGRIEVKRVQGGACTF